MKEKTFKALRDAWKWFNGKKSSIGVIGLSICQLGLVRKNVNPDILEVVNLGFTIIGGVGILHRDYKSDKSIIKKVHKSITDATSKKPVQ